MEFKSCIDCDYFDERCDCCERGVKITYIDKGCKLFKEAGGD